MAHRFLGALRKRGVDVRWRDLHSYRARDGRPLLPSAVSQNAAVLKAMKCPVDQADRDHFTDIGYSMRGIGVELDKRKVLIVSD
jgi:hypothetical protein